MEHHEFQIGGEFYSDRHKYRCTDIGTRIIAAIRIDGMSRTTSSEGKTWTDALTAEKAEADGWFSGPPYPVAERLFDEYDQEGCSLDPHEWDDDEPDAKAS